jgi:hypothetical protein
VSNKCKRSSLKRTVAEAMEGVLTLKDLELVRKEFEDINLTFRQTFTIQARMELIERVKKLVSVIREYEEVDKSKRKDVRDGVLK